MDSDNNSGFNAHLLPPPLGRAANTTPGWRLCVANTAQSTERAIACCVVTNITLFGAAGLTWFTAGVGSIALMMANLGSSSATCNLVMYEAGAGGAITSCVAISSFLMNNMHEHGTLCREDFYNDFENAPCPAICNPNSPFLSLPRWSRPLLCGFNTFTGAIAAGQLGLAPTGITHALYAAGVGMAGVVALSGLIVCIGGSAFLCRKICCCDTSSRGNREEVIVTDLRTELQQASNPTGFVPYVTQAHFIQALRAGVTLPDGTVTAGDIGAASFMERQMHAAFSPQTNSVELPQMH